MNTDRTFFRGSYSVLRPELRILEDVDPDRYADATSVDDLDLEDFHSTDTYFECPLLPRRGNN